METLPQLQPQNDEKIVICVLGNTGAGKSSLLNALAGLHDPENQLFATAREACTMKVSSIDVIIQGKLVTLIDVPGLDDPQSRDQKFLDQMFRELKSFERIHMFLYVKSKAEKLKKSHEDALNCYKQLLGIDNVNHYIAVALTWCDYNTDKHKDLRQYQNYLEKEEKIFKDQVKEQIKVGFNAFEGLNAFAFGLDFSEDDGIQGERYEINIQAIDSKIDQLLNHIEEKKQSFDTKSMKRAFTKDYIEEIKNEAEERTREFGMDLRKWIQSECLKGEIAKFIQEKCVQIRKKESFLYKENYIIKVIQKTEKLIHDKVEVMTNDLEKKHLEVLTNLETKLIGEIDSIFQQENHQVNDQLGKIDDESQKLQNAARIGAFVLSYLPFGGAHIAAAASFTALPVIGIFAGGLIVAGIGIGGLYKLAETNNWKYLDANQIATEQMYKAINCDIDEEIEKSKRKFEEKAQEIISRCESYLIKSNIPPRLSQSLSAQDYVSDRGSFDQRTE